MDHRQLAVDQATCPDIIALKEGKRAPGLHLSEVEFTPGVFVYCDVTPGKKTRPIVPDKHRLPIFKMMQVSRTETILNFSALLAETRLLT